VHGSRKRRDFFVVASYTHIISVCIFPLCVSLALIYITAVTKKGKKQKKFFSVDEEEDSSNGKQQRLVSLIYVI